MSALVPEHVARGVFSTGAVVVEGAYEFVLDFLVRMSSPHQVAARVVLPHAVVGRLILALGENLQNYQKTFGGPPLLQSQPAPRQETTHQSDPTPAEPTSDEPAAVQPQSAPTDPQGNGGHSGLVDSAVNSPGQPHAGSPSQSDTPAQPTVEQPSPEELYEQLKLPESVMSGAYANAVMIGHTASEFCFDFITTFFPRSAVACRVYLSAPNVPRLYESLKHSFEQHQRKVAAARAAKQRPPEQNPPAQ